MTDRTANAMWADVSADAPSFLRFVGKAFEMIAIWQERDRQRAHLGALDARLIKDMGLTEADVWHECRKPFWRE